MMMSHTGIATATTGGHEYPTSAQRLARDRFEYQIKRLQTATRVGRPRQTLDVLVRLCEGLLDDAGAGRIVDQYRLELSRAKAAVSCETDGRNAR
jgi:hypothetical protein